MPSRWSRCEHLSSTPWGLAQCGLEIGHKGIHAFSPSEPMMTKKAAMTSPTVGRTVHYVSYGTPGGEYDSVCRAAVVAGVPLPERSTLDDQIEAEWPSEAVMLDLVVLNPTGLFFNRCPEDQDLHRGGTWHWPERGA